MIFQANRLQPSSGNNFVLNLKYKSCLFLGGIFCCNEFLFEAYSCFPLYLLGYGLRFAPTATQKDAVAIRARISADRSIFYNHHTITSLFVIL